MEIEESSTISARFRREKIRENDNIPRIKFNGSTEIKAIQHADDLTLKNKP